MSKKIFLWFFVLLASFLTIWFLKDRAAGYPFNVNEFLERHVYETFNLITDWRTHMPPPLSGSQNYSAAVETLAEWYVEAHNILGDLEIYEVPDPSGRVVQLIEISDSFPETNDLWPVRLRPTTELPFESAVLIATKQEWEQVKKGLLSIGVNWDLRSIRRVYPREEWTKP
jgi:hypothetical protein